MQHSSSSDGVNSTDLSVLARTARNIHTLDVIDAQSRALIVFNVSQVLSSNTARFASEVTWDNSYGFPGVTITTWTGEVVPSAITDFKTNPDRKGRAGKVRLSFNLDFYVSALASNSWRTYIARFGSTEHSGPEVVLAEPVPHFVVLEAEAQQGELSPFGTL